MAIAKQKKSKQEIITQPANANSENRMEKPAGIQSKGQGRESITVSHILESTRAWARNSRLPLYNIVGTYARRKSENSKNGRLNVLGTRKYENLICARVKSES